MNIIVDLNYGLALIELCSIITNVQLDQIKTSILYFFIYFNY